MPVAAGATGYLKQHAPLGIAGGLLPCLGHSLSTRPSLPTRRVAGTLNPIKEIIFEVCEDEVDGGYNASALGVGIHTEGDTLEELRVNVKEAVDCFFDETMEAPKVIRLHFVRDEVLTR